MPLFKFYYLVYTIIAVVAVFEIHIDNIQVININPNINNFGLEPTNNRNLKAILLCKFHFCIPEAKTNDLS
jgi:hypothetical protein